MINIAPLAASRQPPVRASEPSRERWVMIGASALGVVLLWLSRSATGIVIGLTLCATLGLHKIAQRQRRPAILLLPSAVLLAGWMAFGAGLADGALVLLGRDPTLTGRTEIWREAMTVILEHPIRGHSIVSGWTLDVARRSGAWVRNAHNGYLEIWIDLGAIGLGLLILQMGWLLHRAVRGVGFASRPAALWPLCVGSLFVLYNMSEVMLMQENSIVWVIVVATSLALGTAARRPAPRPARRVEPGRGHGSSTGGAGGDNSPSPTVAGTP